MKIPTVSVDLIVENEKKEILLGKVTEQWQADGKYLWGLPGREVEFGETLVQSALRDIEQETGMQATSWAIQHVNTNFGFAGHYVAVGIVLQATGEPHITKPEDWSAWQWFDSANLPEQLFPSAKATLEAYLSGVVSVDSVEIA